MEAREKIELFGRVVVAWNQGDLDAVLAECTPDFEWDCTHSGIPGLSEVYFGVHQTATGPRSGVDVEIHFAQILEFEDDKTSRAELFGDRDEGRAAAGLDR